MLHGRSYAGAVVLLMGLLIIVLVVSRPAARLRSWPVPLGPAPAALAVAARSGHLFVADSAADTVTMLDARTGAPLATTTVGQAPVALTVDEVHGRVFTLNIPNSCVVTALGPGRVCQNAPSSVSVLDRRRGVLLGTVDVGSGTGALAVDARAGRVLVANWLNGTLTVLSATGRLLRTVRIGGYPAALAVDARSGHAVLTSVDRRGGRSRVHLVDSRTGTLLRTVAVGQVVGDLVCDAATERVLVAGASGLLLLDARSGRTLRRIRGGAPLAVDERAGRALISGQGHLRLVATRDGAPAGTIRDLDAVGTEETAAVDEGSGRFYVATARGLVVLDSHSGRLVRRLALATTPTAVAVDAAAHRLFLLTAGSPGSPGADRSPPLLRWLRWVLPWFPLPAPPTSSAGSTLTMLDTSRL
jgi:YVTN family beta-propeller protein